MLRLDRYAILNVDVDALVPFDDPGALIVDLEASVSVRLTSYVSVNYVLRLRQDAALSPDPAIEQDIRLRFSLEIL